MGGVGFDMRIKGRDGLGFRAGIGGFIWNIDDGITTIPLEVNYLQGKKRGGFIFGAGPLLGSYNYDDFIFNNGGVIIRSNSFFDETPGFKLLGFHANMGYRYTPIKNGLSFQLCWTPIFSASGGGWIPFWAGLSIGYNFR